MALSALTATLAKIQACYILPQKKYDSRFCEIWMLNRYPLNHHAKAVADYCKLHTDKFVRSDRKMLSREETNIRQLAIIECADTLAGTVTYTDFEAALKRMHKLGVFPHLGLVYQVAQTSIMAE
jgi:hypothetical protein